MYHVNQIFTIFTSKNVHNSTIWDIVKVYKILRLLYYTSKYSKCKIDIQITSKIFCKIENTSKNNILYVTSNVITILWWWPKIA